MTEDPSRPPSKETVSEISDNDQEINQQQDEKEETQQETDKDEHTVIIAQKKPVMSCALEVMSVLGSKGKAVLKGRGNSIPTAVAVANVIVDKMMNKKSKIEKIDVDSELYSGEQGGTMISTIEIILVKE